MSNTLKKIFIFGEKSIFSSALILSLTPLTVHAATLDALVDAVADTVATFLPTLLLLAVLVFFWGLVKFISHAGDEKAIADGKQLMVWGMITIFVMVSLWGIVAFFQQELGLDAAADLGTLPAQPDTLPF